MGLVLKRVGYRSGVFQSLCWPISGWSQDLANLKAIFSLLSIGCKTAFFLQLVSVHQWVNLGLRLEKAHW